LSLLDSFFEENEKEDSFYGDVGRRLRGQRDYKWLKWMDRSIASAKLGHLPKKTIKQIPPVLNAWAKKRSRFSALMVQKILTRIMDEREAGNENAIVTTVMCNTLIDAWAKSQDEEAAHKCEVILQWMIDYSSRSDDSEYKHDLQPNVVSYTSVIDALSKSGKSGAAERAERILNMMQSKYEDGYEEVQPNTITFNAVIDAYARTGGAHAAQKAEDLLERMKQLYLDGNVNVQPDVYSFNSVLFAWSNACQCAGAPQRADAILEKMEEACRDIEHCKIDKAGMVQPNTFCYTSCMNAWGKSKEKGKARRAYEILQRMNQMYRAGAKHAKPNVVAYTTVINACAYSEGSERSDAFDIACETFEELRSHPGYGYPNHATYSQFLTAAIRLLPSLNSYRMDAIRKIFKQCCHDGQVNPMVFRLYQKVMNENGTEFPGLLSKKILGLTYEQLPDDWKCNVKGFRRGKCSHREVKVIAIKENNADIATCASKKFLVSPGSQ